MKFWLDDVRPIPEPGWTHCHSVNEMITALSYIDVDSVEEISLDHDLGIYHDSGGDGYQVVLWMARNDKWPKVLKVHSANPVGVERMLGVIDRYGPYKRKVGLNGRSY